MSGQLGRSRGHSRWRRSQTLSRLSLRDTGPVGTYLLVNWSTVLVHKPSDWLELPPLVAACSTVS